MIHPHQSHVEYAFSKLTLGKRGVLGILHDSSRGLFLLGGGYNNRVIRFWAAQGGNIFTEQDFSNHLIFRLKKDDEEPWYVIAANDKTCVATSFLGDPLVVIALIEPLLGNSVDVNSGEQAPICLKLLFSNEGCAIAIAQDRNICILWELEGNALLSNVPDSIHKDCDAEGHGKYAEE